MRYEKAVKMPVGPLMPVGIAPHPYARPAGLVSQSAGVYHLPFKYLNGFGGGPVGMAGAGGCSSCLGAEAGAEPWYACPWVWVGAGVALWLAMR